MEIKELRIGRDGLDARLIIDGEEIKVGKLADTKELKKAQNYLCSVICEQFFELIRMYADEKGIEMHNVFNSQNDLDDAFESYIADVMDTLVKNAVLHSKVNWELFKEQKGKRNKPKHEA